MNLAALLFIFSILFIFVCMGPTLQRNTSVLDTQAFVSYVFCLQLCKFLIRKPRVLFVLCCMCMLVFMLVCVVLPRYLCDGVLGSCWDWIEFGNFKGICPKKVVW